MADQNATTGAVDPRAEESNTGSQTGMAAVTVQTDAAGQPLTSTAGEDPEPVTDEQSVSAEDVGSLSGLGLSDAAQTGGQASPSEDPTKSLIEEHADGDKDASAAITDVSSGIRSVANTSAMVERSNSQSPEMQTGAQVAHSNAVGSMVKRFETLCEEIGEDAAKKVAEGIARFHKVEDAVRDALKKAGVIS